VRRPNDCISACLAHVLDMPTEEVPYFWGIAGNDGERMEQRIREWLDELGYSLWFLSIEANAVSDVLYAMSRNAGQKWILGGSTNNKNHAVVCRGNEVIWNPAVNAEISAAALTETGERRFFVFIIGAKL